MVCKNTHAHIFIMMGMINALGATQGFWEHRGSGKHRHDSPFCHDVHKDFGCLWQQAARSSRKLHMRQASWSGVLVFFYWSAAPPLAVSVFMGARAKTRTNEGSPKACEQKRITSWNESPRM